MLRGKSAASSDEGRTRGRRSDPVGILNEARREFIAAPDSAKRQIVFKWPDHNIRKYAKAIVEPDQMAVLSWFWKGRGSIWARSWPFSMSCPSWNGTSTR